jgi:prepilin-type N-terminal cleavage/methylation domain-containing protein
VNGASYREIVHHEGTKSTKERMARAAPATYLDRSGFTLVEVLLAALILGVGLTVLLSSLSTCMRTMSLAKQYEQVEWALGLGELTYPDPVKPSTDATGVVKDYAVDGDSSLVDGFTFERHADEKTDDELKKDRLFVVHTTVTWGEKDENGNQPQEELVRYVWQRPH